jgi:hypothetical protein
MIQFAAPDLVIAEIEAMAGRAMQDAATAAGAPRSDVSTSRAR